MGRLMLALMLSVVVASPAAALPAPATPFTQDPMGPIVDVTDDHERYQPANAFCVKPEGFEFSGNTGATATGADPACAFSGYAADETDLYKVEIVTPPMCDGCRRLFIDFSQIPDSNEPPNYYARGHTYFRLQSLNPGYVVDPLAHSPNFKNLTNDKFVVPDGSPQEPVVAEFDMRSMAFVANPAYTKHTQVQGPYYVGPWYVNRSGERINGLYLDVQNQLAVDGLPPAFNEISYGAGFNSGEVSCIDNFPAFAQYKGGNYYYGGCFDRFGASSRGV